MSRLLSFTCRAGLILVTVLLSLPARAGVERGCALDVMKRYLGELPGWQIRALETGAGGVRIVMQRDAEPKYLMIGVGLEGERLHTFTAARGTQPNAEIPPDVVPALDSVWDRLWNDPEAQHCEKLTVASAPVGDDVYKRMSDMILELETVPPPEEEPVLTWIVLALGVVAVAAAVVLLVLRRRKRRSATVVPPVPESAPDAPSESSPEPSGGPDDAPPPLA